MNVMQVAQLNVTAAFSHAAQPAGTGQQPAVDLQEAALMVHTWSTGQRRSQDQHKHAGQPSQGQEWHAGVEATRLLDAFDACRAGCVQVAGFARRAVLKPL